MMSDDCELITLRGGLTVPVSALRVLWGLEKRGVDVRLDGDDIVVRPTRLLTDADCAEIRRLRPYVVALIAYCGAVDARQ